MKYIIDTHIFIWIFSEPEKLKPYIRAILDDPETRLIISPIVLYEIQQKKLLGKLDFEPDLEELLGEMYFDILDIKSTHTIATHDLPMIHKDPFDRILIAQSVVEKIPLITADKEIKKYDFQFIPA